MTSPENPGSRPCGPDDHSDVCTSEWAPAVDIREFLNVYVISADLPGLAPEDIEVTVDGHLLTLRGTRPPPPDPEAYARRERPTGVFYRRFQLPEGIDPEGISAGGRNGVLEVTIPRRRREPHQRIPVEA
jgi:HSP20 family protein